jgi:hypothetical protein
VLRLIRPKRAVRLALALWLVFAFAVWNVVFDRVIVVAGRQYVHAAVSRAATGGYERIDDWMGPARIRAFRIATAAAAAVLLTGLASIAAAARARRRPEEIPCAPSRTP